MKNLFGLSVAMISAFCVTLSCEQTLPERESAHPYHPMFWVDGGGNLKNLDREKADDLVASLRSSGWQGIMYWGADRNGEVMDYYFPSPFLETQDWGVSGGDGLTHLIQAAHHEGMKVMINIEDVNPYHWKQNHWTPANISSVMNDLAATGVDAVFEEVFEVKPDVFLSMAKTLEKWDVNYISGTDPMILREANFTSLWPGTGTIDIYNYYLKRDKIFSTATLAQHGSLGYGWAKYWAKPTAMISPLNRNWGIPTECSRAVVSYLCMIRALQFRLDNFIIYGGRNEFNPVAVRSWINHYVDRQETDRPLMNIVVLLKKEIEYSEDESVARGWNRLFNSGDALTSGALHAGYNIVVSDRVLPADAYWIYAPAGPADSLPDEVVSLLHSKKPVFIQAAGSIPGGDGISSSWKEALAACGVDATHPFNDQRFEDHEDENSLPSGEEQEIPYTGYYKGVYLRFTGSDVQRGLDLRAGTVVPETAIRGTVYAEPNKTYGKGPYIIGMNEKYLVTASCLNWEAAYPISDLLAGCGVLPSSNVWGIAGRNVTALLAIETTELEMKIPDLPDGSMIHVVVLDRNRNKKYEETVRYEAPYRHMLMEYDFILIDPAQ